MRTAVLALGLALSAAPVYATTPSTTPDCAEHGHDAEHNPHCDESTTTSSSTTTTSFIVELPANPTTTTTGKTFVVPTTTTTTTGPALVIEPPHIDVPAVLTTTTVPAQVLSTTRETSLPRTGVPLGFLAVCAVCALILGVAGRYLARPRSEE